MGVLSLSLGTNLYIKWIGMPLTSSEEEAKGTFPHKETAFNNIANKTILSFIFSFCCKIKNHTRNSQVFED